MSTSFSAFDKISNQNNTLFVLSKSFERMIFCFVNLSVCVCVCQRERGCVPVRIFPTSPIFFFSYLDKSPCLPPPHSNRTFRDTILPHLHRNSCSSKDSRRGFLSLLPLSFGYSFKFPSYFIHLKSFSFERTSVRISFVYQRQTNHSKKKYGSRSRCPLGTIQGKFGATFKDRAL